MSILHFLFDCNLNIGFFYLERLLASWANMLCLGVNILQYLEDSQQKIRYFFTHVDDPQVRPICFAQEEASLISYLIPN